MCIAAAVGLLAAMEEEEEGDCGERRRCGREWLVPAEMVPLRRRFLRYCGLRWKERIGAEVKQWQASIQTDRQKADRQTDRQTDTDSQTKTDEPKQERQPDRQK